ncbi:MAG: ATP-binding cassette domain-containing protein [Candidatus Wallbacteria bacterium]|nr:ATP-binding cassette domain-containing protein [Candidatus Wallbacteria bacterium]
MIEFHRVTNVFGPSAKVALERLRAGQSRDEILEQTGNLVATAEVTLEVRRGEIVVLMGLSGSGKSTLLRCANALVRPVEGRVLVRDGDEAVELGGADARTLRRIRQRRVSMVFQKFALLPWRTLRGNVAFGLEVQGMPPEQSLPVVDEMLDRVGLSGWKDKCPHELSGGMQQRVGLARALATNADILLLDEPFSALDPLIRSKMQGELLGLQRELEKTMLFVTHDLDEALKLGTRVAIMEGGRLIQVGSPEEIVTRPQTDYVRRFVSHVNPLNVLCARSLMRPIGELARDAGLVTLDGGAVHVRLDEGGRPREAELDGMPVPIVRYSARGEGALPEPTLFSAGCEEPIRLAIDAVHASGRPLLLLDADGRLVGVVTGAEILRALASGR